MKYSLAPALSDPFIITQKIITQAKSNTKAISPCTPSAIDRPVPIFKVFLYQK